MRIITGTAKGKRLKAPSGSNTRPTAAALKEAMFSAVQFDVGEAAVLDLFAGSGQLGIEALSRGAKKAYFVDASSAAVAVIRENLSAAGLSGKARVLRLPADAFLRVVKETFDIAFLDPPYGKNAVAEILPSLIPKMSLNGIIVCEHETKAASPETAGGFKASKVYTCGAKSVTIYRKREERMVTAIYPGSFDPVTFGHIDIIKRAAKLFDKIVVLVSINPAKPADFSIGERVDFLRRCTKKIKNIEIDSDSGLFIDYFKKKGADVIVKGIRAMSDFEYEFQMALINKDLYHPAETVFLSADAASMFLSSSAVKQIAMFGGDISAFVPDCILKDILERMRIK